LQPLDAKPDAAYFSAAAAEEKDESGWVKAEK